MKKATYTLVLISLCMIAATSCRKSFHCSCSYNNKVVYTQDLGLSYEKNAQDKCTSYDSTVTGEVWNCTLY